MYVPHKGAYILIFTESLLPVFHNYYFPIGSLHFLLLPQPPGSTLEERPRGGGGRKNFSAIHIFLSVRLILCYDIVRV